MCASLAYQSMNCSCVRTTFAAAAAGTSGLAGALLVAGRPRELLLVVDIIEILFPFSQRKRVGNHRLVKFYFGLKVKLVDLI